MDIYQVLEDGSRKFGNKPALIYKDQAVSFSELFLNVKRLANVLKAHGISKSDKVAVYLPNTPEYVYAYLACFCLGAVAVPLDIMLKSDELTSCLGHSESELLIALSKPDVDFSLIQSNVPTLKHIIYLNAQPVLGGLIAQAASEWKPVEVEAEDPALIMYTSGTTGKPKGILLNYRHLEGSPKAMEYFVDLSDRDVKLCAIPLSHIGGFVYIQNCIMFGITLVLMDRFHPLEFLRHIQQYRVTCFHIVPAMYNAILTLKNLDQFDLSSLRWVVVFGAPSSPEVLERFHQYCPNAQLLNGWGMTETCPPNTVTPLVKDAASGARTYKLESIGKPSPHCEIKIVDNENRELPQGQVGEIVIRGWVVMQEYYKDPELTASVKKNGWFHTGDLGRYDEEGYLYIMGRIKEMVKVAGQLVMTPEVESAFYKHPDIAEAAVIGVPDELRGEVLKAFVVLKEDSPMTAEDLRYFAREHLAHFKVPQTIELRAVLPKNRTGKIDKEVLKQESMSAKT